MSPYLVNYPTLGWAAVAWMEALLCHGPGDVIGERLELDDEVVKLICDCYRLYPDGHKKAGRRVYRRAVWSRPKGRAKSEVAGMIVCWEALGDCRFSHWAEEGERSWWGYEYQPGEPVGVPVVSPMIRCLATEAGQADNTYGNVRTMLDTEPIAELYPGVDIGATRVLLPDDGWIRPSTAASASKDGGKETFAVDDETHLAETRDLREMYEVVARNLRKRKAAEGWMFETTTAFRPGMDSIAERAAEYAGSLGSPEARAERAFLYDHREAPKVDDIRNRDQVMRALREVYGPFADIIDLDAIADDFLDPTRDESDLLRYFFNQSTTGALAWLTGGELNGMFDPTVSLEPGEPIALGFDGSRFHDSTGLIAVTEDWRFVALNIWQNDGSLGWEVPQAEVDEAVASAHEHYTVVRAHGDPPYWETQIAAWCGRWPDVWHRWPTQGEKRMSEAVAAATTTIRTGVARVQAGGDFGDLLRDHMRNAQKKYLTGVTAVHAMQVNNAAPFVLTKDRRGSPRKIDGAVARVLAHEAGRVAHEGGLWIRARRRNRRRRARFVALSD